MPIFSAVVLAALGLSFSVQAAVDYSHGQQGSLSSDRYAGSHAILSASDDAGSSSFHYNQNGDLLRIESNDANQRLTNVYFVNRKLKSVTDGLGKKTRFYLTLGGQKIAVRHPGGKVDTYPEGFLQMTDDQARYSYGEVRDGDNGQLWFTVNDQVGSVLATISSNQVLERMDRYPFGEDWLHERGSVEGGFNDRNFHNYEEEGPYTYFPARHLLKEYGMFIQADSIVPRADTLGFNRYAYVDNNPINRIDPSGHIGMDAPIGWKDGWNPEQAAEITKRNGQNGALPLLLTAEVGVSVAPWAGECYDTACLGAGESLILSAAGYDEMAEFTTLDYATTGVGLVSVVGAGALARLFGRFWKSARGGFRGGSQASELVPLSRADGSGVMGPASTIVPSRRYMGQSEVNELLNDGVVRPRGEIEPGSRDQLGRHVSGADLDNSPFYSTSVDADGWASVERLFGHEYRATLRPGLEGYPEYGRHLDSAYSQDWEFLITGGYRLDNVQVLERRNLDSNQWEQFWPMPN